MGEKILRVGGAARLKTTRYWVYWLGELGISIPAFNHATEATWQQKSPTPCVIPSHPVSNDEDSPQGTA
jgi:hypothetical protein